MTVDDLRTLLADASAVADDPAPILRALAAIIYRGDEDLARELIIRSLAVRHAFGAASPVLDSLVRQVGLFPYLDPESLNVSERIAYEYHRPENLDDDGIVFHRPQAEVYRELMAGNSVILSAPTSFGKSLVIDALIASNQYGSVAIVVPTLALMDETRRRLHRFGGDFKIITHSSQAPSKRNLFVMTQERLAVLEPLPEVDLLVIDEFYKLQASGTDQRFVLLNQILYRYHKRRTQFYLLGPNIRALPDGVSEELRCTFFFTQYNTVVTEVRHLPRVPNIDTALVELCRTLSEPTIIYCASPNRVRHVAQLLVEAGLGTTDSSLSDAVAWLAEHYHPGWTFVRAMGAGIGVHHGRIPRAWSQYVVRKFNDGSLPFLVCTSTLIEGVNTKAKNVVIYDNKVAREKFDFFTYSNIRGRSGRMFSHFIGRVFVFHPPPVEELPFVDIPVVTQGTASPEELLLQIDEEDLSDDARQRVAALAAQGLLPIELLRQASGVDPKQMLALARELRARPRWYAHAFMWHRTTPSYDELKLLMNLLWRHFGLRPGYGVYSERHLVYRLNELSRAPSERSLIQSAIDYKPAIDPDDAVSEVLDFLRQWASFRVPRLLRAAHLVQEHVLTQAGEQPGNFLPLADRIESWYRTPALKALDEFGIPVQLSERLRRIIDFSLGLDGVLEQLRSLDLRLARLQPVEAEILQDVLDNL